MWRTTGFVAVACFTLTACSSVPDAVNPVEWYKGTTEFFSGDDETKTAEAEKPPVPGEGEGYPNLASVPDKPGTSSEEQRKKLAEGLVSDNQNARYTENPAAAREAPRRALNPTPPKPSTAAAPPAPAPAAPVSSQPAAIPTPPAAPAAAIPAPPAPRLQAPLAQGNFQQNQQFNGQTFDSVAGQGTLVISSNSVGYGSAPTASRSLADGNIPAGTQPLSAYLPSGTGQSVHLATIQFGNGSANLSGRDRQILSQVAQIAAARGGTLRVVGHASRRTQDMDPAQHSDVNAKISAARANSVAQAIVAMGVAPQRLYVGGASASEPRFLEVMPSGEAGNRRAEIYIDM
ncbi:MAG: OmpA family protein [Rhodospirillales bacterium]